jgi:lipopolysaccharide/colanic/teichoic acid biosynthesis glycosyltransferase
LIGDDSKMEKMQSVIDRTIDQKSLINNVSKTYLCVKRIFDIVVSFLAILLLSFILLTTVIWIKIRSRGAVLHSEEKYGLGGSRVITYEFSKIVTNTYISKLPLLFNVLKGNMSLVGPQPMSAGDITKDDWCNLRMSAKPGITGLWQVNGKYGGISEMVRVDLKYIRERSLWNDFKIILKTICLMFGEKRSSR